MEPEAGHASYEAMDRQLPSGCRSLVILVVQPWSSSNSWVLTDQASEKALLAKLSAAEGEISRVMRVIRSRGQTCKSSRESRRSMRSQVGAEMLYVAGNPCQQETVARFYFLPGSLKSLPSNDHENVRAFIGTRKILQALLQMTSPPPPPRKGGSGCKQKESCGGY